MNIFPPKIKADLSPCADLGRELLMIFEDACIEDMLFDKQILTAFTALPVEFKSCRFSGCRFSGCMFSKMQFTDVRFSNCDFSNTNLDDSVFHRVVMDDCKLMGCTMNGSYLRNTLFSGCDCRYINIRKGNLKDVRLADCNMDGSIFTETKLSLLLENCILTNSSFLSTSLNKINLASCQIGGVRLTLDDLKGAVISPEQAVTLAHLLGVTVKG